MNTHTLELDDNDLTVLNMALGEAPYRLAAPLIAKINQQIKPKDDEGNEPAAE